MFNWFKKRNWEHRCKIIRGVETSFYWDDYDKDPYDREYRMVVEVVEDGFFKSGTRFSNVLDIRPGSVGDIFLVNLKKWNQI